MASIPVTVESNLGQPREGEANGDGRFIRVIVADTQAIFRAGLRKIFALEDDIRVVGQSETMAQTLSAAKKFSADILILESALSSNPAEALSELLRQSPALRVVVVTPQPDEELTLDLFRRGAHGIVSREVEPELLVDCLRKVAEGEPWLDSKGNKEIAQRVGTTEQVVKNYLRKVYDKLGVADRLELALFCLHNRVLESSPKAPIAPQPSSGNGSAPSLSAIAQDPKTVS